MLHGIAIRPVRATCPTHLVQFHLIKPLTSMLVLSTDSPSPLFYPQSEKPETHIDCGLVGCEWLSTFRRSLLPPLQGKSSYIFTKPSNLNVFHTHPTQTHTSIQRTIVFVFGNKNMALLTQRRGFPMASAGFLNHSVMSSVNWHLCASPRTEFT